MKYPQVISFGGANPDAVLAFWGGYVVDDTTQLPITSGPITVDIDLFDVTALPSGSAIATISSKTLTYNSASGFWTLLISDISSGLADLHKYVGKISEVAPYTKNMRAFAIDEFSVDNNSFEETVGRLPFQVEIGATSWIKWYDAIDPLGTCQYKAKAYEGGTGLTYATDPTRVTHRGPVIPGP